MERQIECVFGKSWGRGGVVVGNEVERLKPKGRPEKGEQERERFHPNPVFVSFLKAGKHSVCPCIFALF